jgi:hypothetical protein
MSIRSRSQRLPRTALKCIIALSAISVGVTFAPPSVTANGDTPLVWSDYFGQACIEDGIEDDLGSETSVLITTALAPTEAGGLIYPTASYNVVPPLTVNLTIPDEFFDAERAAVDEDGILFGFYLVSFEFVDDCDSRQPVAFTPCFVTTAGPAPWVLDLGDLHMLISFFAEQPGFGNLSQLSTLEITNGSSGCAPEDPDGGPDGSDPWELAELIDEFDLEFAYHVDLRPDIDIDIDHFLRMAETQENALPNTR